ncbi:class I SAM-dependent methyltransferase [Metabacillus sediminilitoris]|uniref:Class I SAM-dependent methyltransferase n=1 Tax=Metabacillus sediminilitoris TaxID=2567941 RepID=A0A4S4C0E1_9BACI|nr:class I SAM-dependent methyltransferase [Metabacillus sediminilitoris]QGQ44710.1 methyltransferase domain-containing protein [Metabacillus sediminilitoris]THF78942.1 class I SAM-dependent methyltransferase [Metabacillus sediminilitoris]
MKTEKPEYRTFFYSSNIRVIVHYYLFCYGLDINPSLIRAGQEEIKKANLSYKKPSLIVNDSFEFNVFNKKFDLQLLNHCFTFTNEHYSKMHDQYKKVLKHGAKFHANNRGSIQCQSSQPGRFW